MADLAMLNFDGIPISVSTNVSTNLIWNDGNNANLLSPTDQCKGLELTRVLPLAKHFLNSYVTGEHGHLNLSDTLLAFIVSSGEGSKTWGAKYFPEGLFQISLPQETWKKVTKEEIKDYFLNSKMETVVEKSVPSDNIVPGVSPTAASSSKGGTEETSDLNNHITSIDEVFNWYTNMIVLLDSSQDLVDKALKILQLLSLVLFRIICKTTLSIETFINTRFEKVFNNLYDLSSVMNIVRPHEKFMTVLEKSIQRGSSSSNRILKHILSIYWKESLNKTDQDKKVISILSAGCLLHLKFNGMLIVKSIITLSHLSGQGIKELMIWSAYEAYRTTLTRLISVFTSYFKENDTSLFPWCRLLNDAYHNDLRSLDNRPYLLLLFYTIDLLDDNSKTDIFRQHPFNGRPENIDDNVKRWGAAIKGKMTLNFSAKAHPQALQLNPSSSAPVEGDRTFQL